MSAFGIFALILTTAYIIYFAVIICRDIILGRKNPDNAGNSETFDVSGFAEEESVEVKEIDGGFAVGEAETISEPIVVIPLTSNDKPAETDKTDASKELTEKMDDSEKDVEFEVRFEADEFMGVLQDHGNGTSHLISKKIEVAADKSSDSSAGDETPVDQF